jgi:biofilm PGA synthesis N-glycosyltransferase PgaC
VSSVATEQRLLVISPVRNEERHIELIADAVARQTRPPDLWLVIDDGSTDSTREILGRLAERMGFLRVRDSSRLAPGPARADPRVKDQLASAAEAKAFNMGLRSVPWRSFTHIAKLDGDTELPPRYFELLLGEFAADRTLGLAGGVYADPDSRGAWKVVSIPPEHHVPGALKCYSLACFEAVGGIQERLGWDTIDETYARMRGYRTRAFAGLVAHHHRPWGSADGTLRGRARHGQCAYVVHFPLAWVAMRALKLARTRPRGLSGVAFMYGYLRSGARRAPRVEDPAFRSFVRREIRGRVRSLGGRATGGGESYSPTGSSVSSQ